MARFNILSTLKNESIKNREAAVDATAGGSGQFDDSSLVWLDGRGKQPDPQAQGQERSDVTEKARLDALDRRAAFLKERFGVDVQGSFRPRTDEELATLATTCVRWLGLAEEHLSRQPAVADALNRHIQTLAEKLPSVVGLRVCRGLMRQGLGALTRAAGVTPELSRRLRVMESTGAARSEEEQDKRDRLLDSVEESKQGLRSMLDLVSAVERASDLVGLHDFRGNRVQSLDRNEELLASVVALEMGSRKGQVRYRMGGYLPTGTSAEAKQAHKERLAAAYRKIEAEEAPLARRLYAAVDFPKAVRTDRTDSFTIASRQMESAIGAAYRLQQALNVTTGATVAEQTGKSSAGHRDMFSVEAAAIAKNLAQAPYEPKRAQALDEDGLPVAPVGLILPQLPARR